MDFLEFRLVTDDEGTRFITEATLQYRTGPGKPWVKVPTIDIGDAFVNDVIEGLDSTERLHGSQKRHWDYRIEREIKRRKIRGVKS